MYDIKQPGGKLTCSQTRGIPHYPSRSDDDSGNYSCRIGTTV
jgi:hypothetical protein